MTFASPGLRLDEPGADDRGDDGEAADHERIDHAPRRVVFTISAPSSMVAMIVTA